MPGALLVARHTAHYLINVLTAARPRCFLAHFARYGTTHKESPFDEVNYQCRLYPREYYSWLRDGGLARSRDHAAKQPCGYLMGVEAKHEQIRGDLVWRILCERKNSTDGPGGCLMCCDKATNHLGRVRRVGVLLYNRQLGEFTVGAGVPNARIRSAVPSTARVSSVYLSVNILWSEWSTGPTTFH